MNDDLGRFQRILGYQFSDLQWLQLALTHRSVSGRRNNERLEFLGDALLNFVIADCLYLQFPDQDEGRLSRLRATLVRQDSLAIIAKEWSVGDFLMMGSGELRTGGFRKESILADTVEAVIGAMHRDGAELSLIQTCIRRWFGDRLLNLEAGDSLKDAKSRLQEWLQARKRELPSYEVLAITGEAHEQQFHVACRVNETLTTEGIGASRRIAEQQAAAVALATLQPVKESP